AVPKYEKEPSMNAKFLVAAVGILTSAVSLAQGYGYGYGYARPVQSVRATVDDRYDLARLESLLARMDAATGRMRMFELRQIDNELNAAVADEAAEARTELAQARVNVRRDVAYGPGAWRGGHDMRQAREQEQRLVRIDA